MQVILKEPSTKPCSRCGRPDTRKAVVKDEEFSGPLCKDCTWDKCDAPLIKKSTKTKDEAGAATSAKS